VDDILRFGLRVQSFSLEDVYSAVFLSCILSQINCPSCMVPNRLRPDYGRSVRVLLGESQLSLRRSEHVSTRGSVAGKIGQNQSAGR
jgi:hypothetical protein